MMSFVPTDKIDTLLQKYVKNSLTMEDSISHQAN